MKKIIFTTKHSKVEFSPAKNGIYFETAAESWEQANKLSIISKHIEDDEVKETVETQKEEPKRGRKKIV